MGNRIFSEGFTYLGFLGPKQEGIRPGFLARFWIGLWADFDQGRNNLVLQALSTGAENTVMPVLPGEFLVPLLFVIFNPLVFCNDVKPCL